MPKLKVRKPPVRKNSSYDDLLRKHARVNTLSADAKDVEPVKATVETEVRKTNSSAHSKPE